VGQALPGDRFDSWLLYYRAVLGLQPEESWVLPDPYGLVKSRALTNASRTIRLPLSFSESNRTWSPRSLTTFAGAGRQPGGVRHGRHLPRGARHAADGASACCGSRRTTTTTWPRAWGLDDAVIDQLRDHDVLYDRDPNGGEFLHAYTQTFHDRFFFEIVERRGGYDQYGAVNAPVRMAAQARAAAQPAI
jgi:4-hydroxyphenylpyruvate dioxygenase